MKRWRWWRFYAYPHGAMPGWYFEVGLNYEKRYVTLMLGFWSVGIYVGRTH